jgi:hypothetical protein
LIFELLTGFNSYSNKDLPNKAIQATGIYSRAFIRTVFGPRLIFVVGWNKIMDDYPYE